MMENLECRDQVNLEYRKLGNTETQVTGTQWELGNKKFREDWEFGNAKLG